MSGILLAIAGNSYAARPINTSVPVISGSVIIGSTLTSSTGTWTGTDPISYTYQWQRGASDISGATSNSYTIQVADEGSTLRCVVTATNIAGSTSANSANTAVVTNPGKYIAVASSLTPFFTLLDHTTPGSLSLATTYALGSAARGVDFDPSGNYIAVSTTGQPQLTLLSHSAGSVSLATTYTTVGNGGNYNSVRFNAAGNKIVLGHQSAPYVTLLNHSSGSVSLASTYDVGGITSGVAFSPTANYIGVSHNTDPKFTLISYTSGGSMSLATTYAIAAASFPSSTAFSPSGDYIATDGLNLLDHTTPGSLSLATYNSSWNGIGFAFSPDGDYLATGSLTLLNHSSGSLSVATTFSLGATANSYAFNALGNYFAVAVTNSTSVRLLNHSSGSVSLAATYAAAGGAGGARGIAFSPN